MKLTAKILTVAAALLVTVSFAQAQGGVRPFRGGGSPPDSARRAAVRNRIAALTPEQRTKLRARAQAARVERRAVIAKVRSGQLTRAQARAELRTWKKTNRPNALRQRAGRVQ